MKYIFKNIKQFLIKHTFIFVLFILCQIVSILVLAFSIGIFQNYNQIRKEEDVDSRFLDVQFKKEVEFKDVKKSLTSIVKDEDKLIDTLFIGAGMGKKMLTFNLEIDENQNKIIFNKNIWESTTGFLFGRYMTLEEYMNGEKYAIVSYDLGVDVNEVTGDIKFKDNIHILNDTYKIIGIRNEEADPGRIVDISYYAAPDELAVFVIGISYVKLPTMSQYQQLKDIFEFVFGDNVIFPDFKVADKEEQYFYNTIIITSIIIAFLSAVYLTILFHYLLGFRRKTLAVFCINGCTKAKIRRLYIGEVLIITVPLFLLSMLGYHIRILPRLSTIFPYISPVYTGQVYLLMFSIYTGIVYMILNIMVYCYLKKVPVRLLKGGVG